MSTKKLEHSPKTNIEIPLSGLGSQSERWGWKLQLCEHVDTQRLTLGTLDTIQKVSQMFTFPIHPGKDQQVLILQKLLYQGLWQEPLSHKLEDCTKMEFKFKLLSSK